MPSRGSRNTTVLVVDDNWSLLRVISRGLEVGGYDVLTAETGDDAIELVTNGQRPDVVLTDGVMPGDAQGRDLARHLKPKTPSSGYTRRLDVRLYRRSPGSNDKHTRNRLVSAQARQPFRASVRAK